MALGRRGFNAAAVALALTGALGVATAHAQDPYPNRPINLVVGFPPGGSNDIVARILAPKLGEILGTAVVVVNKPGSNALIGTDFVARAAPDGYTLTLASASPLAISPHTYAKIPFDPVKDLTGITTVAATPELVAVHPSVHVKTLAELVALSKTRQVTLASSGNGGLPHLAIELLHSVSKGNFLHVPYKGAGRGGRGRRARRRRDHGPAGVAGPGEGGQAQCAGGHQHAALARVAAGPHLARRGLPRGAGVQLVRRARPCRAAEADRRKTAQGPAAGREFAGRAASHGEGGDRADDE
jgi:hypothetical protein